MSPEELQKTALDAISQLWPGLDLRKLRRGSKDQEIVFARWVLTDLLHTQAGLSRRIVAELLNWRSSGSVAYAASALMRDVETNRVRAQRVSEAESLFRRLLEGRALTLA